ncbi:Riboflavin biosynthesis protein [Helicobacter sp. NHP19-012]|uniref:Riboflavin biosynthesis protein n=1 Tax=Helicobacter gastrofelis TaxID=2849642 RepID=A0ABM7SFX0_9HELI|nr:MULTISPECIES: bifunctional riboflavin kinase/FAD synthetase [unclassified Helicobacter]BCZ19761.1 Riboflavin biosynthesis protein [Helicobacter sp. NHP19-012]GMB95441.1 Riboflavin biosynthesis protein [Helicobacter sp. NHP22-001]
MPLFFAKDFKDTENTSLAIGKFDGVHLAHQKLLSLLDDKGAVLIVDWQRTKGVLTSLKERIALLKAHAKRVYFLPLEQVCTLLPGEFVALLLAKCPHLQKIVVGYDFHFGLNKMGDTQTLQNLLPPQICLEIMPAFKIKGMVLHARHIRTCLKRGEVALAAQFLTRPFSLEGAVISGQHLGSNQLYPTLNMAIPPNALLPAFGVYAVQVQLEGSSQIYAGVSFLGERLSTDRHLALETHLINAHLPTPPKALKVSFIQKIRDNVFFDNLPDLKVQISKDLQQAKALLKPE